MAMPRNRQRPTGGVTWPTAEAMTHTIPKWIGWMPRISAAGRSTGTVTRMISDGVRNVPRNR